MGKELIDVSTSTRIIEISGFVGNPQDARRSAGNQYFFVNGRYFRSPYFHKAVMKAYDKLIPEGTYPSYYLFFSTPPENVDVNIHPSKTEVKFENETEIFELLTAVVREALGRGSFIPTIDFDHDTLPDIPAPSQFHYSKGGGGSSGGGRSVSGKKVDYGAILPEAVDFPGHRSTAFAAEALSPAEPDVAGYGHIFEDSGTAGSGAGVLQISSRYIATPHRHPHALRPADSGRAQGQGTDILREIPAAAGRQFAHFPSGAVPVRGDPSARAVSSADGGPREAAAAGIRH